MGQICRAVRREDILLMSQIMFTTSWDDGSVLDLKVADLLSRYGMRGTFYIPMVFDGKGGKYAAYDRRLNEEEIRALASSHEVGGHSLSHRRLTDVPSADMPKEIAGSQEFLSTITGHPVKMFAFPGGKYNERVVDTVRQSGFVGARTTHKLAVQRPIDAFQMGTTIICQPFPFRKVDATHYYWRQLLNPLRAYHPMQFAFTWQALARRVFRKAYTNGDYFHLYGHSWELEQYGMWGELESFLDFVKSHENVRYETNGEIAEQI